MPNAQPQSSHTGDAAALAANVVGGGGGGGCFFKCHFLFFGRPEHTSSCLGTEKEAPSGKWRKVCLFLAGAVLVLPRILSFFFYTQQTWSHLEKMFILWNFATPPMEDFLRPPKKHLQPPAGLPSHPTKRSFWWYWCSCQCEAQESW